MPAEKTGATGDSGLASGDGALSGQDSGLGGDSSLGGLGADTSTDPATAVTTAFPPGLYGNQNSLTVEVSRIPRQEEYIQQQANLLAGDLQDVTSDIKTVSYYIQTTTAQGVSDDLNVFDTSNGLATGYAGGLVRRALDRGVTEHAEENADTQRLARTGVLVAPEIVALEFAYFDGELAQWVYEWDSSQQGMPWLVQISIAFQDLDSAEEIFELQPGTSLSTLTLTDRRNLGLEVYELIVAIPGANLTTDSAQSADTAAGLDAVGL